MAQNKAYIKVTKDGPYMVYGKIPISQEIIIPDEEGASWEYSASKKLEPCKEPCALCRCGRSDNKPFCNGEHAKEHWDGTETANNKPVLQDATEYEGPNLTLCDNEEFCAYARFCDAKGRVWNLVQEGSKESDDLAIREAWACPAGRLLIKDKEGHLLEPKLEKEVIALEDPAIGCSGPLWIKGGVEVQSVDGKIYEVRNRVTLCRCGRSSNKPFCDGSHAATGGGAQ